MKKFLFALGVVSLVFVYSKIYAERDWQANASSVTSASAVAAYISDTQMGDVLKYVTVGSCGGGLSSMTIYDSSGSALQPITPTINLSSGATATGTASGDCRKTYYFDLRISSGITYTSTASFGNAPSIGIYYYKGSKLSTTYP